MTSQYTVSIILVVITTVKEQRVVAISLLHSNVTFVDNLIRHWMESATTMLVVAFTFALVATLAMERRRTVRNLRRVETGMVENCRQNVIATR